MLFPFFSFDFFDLLIYFLWTFFVYSYIHLFCVSLPFVCIYFFALFLNGFVFQIISFLFLLFCRFHLLFIRINFQKTFPSSLFLALILPATTYFTHPPPNPLSYSFPYYLSHALPQSFILSPASFFPTPSLLPLILLPPSTTYPSYP